MSFSIFRAFLLAARTSTFLCPSLPKMSVQTPSFPYGHALGPAYNTSEENQREWRVLLPLVLPSLTLHLLPHFTSTHTPATTSVYVPCGALPALAQCRVLSARARFRKLPVFVQCRVLSASSRCGSLLSAVRCSSHLGAHHCLSLPCTAQAHLSSVPVPARYRICLSLPGATQ